MNEYPLPKYHFQVDWGEAEFGFSEISGLDLESDVMEYRNGNDESYTVKKMPGLKKYSNITMKRGYFKSKNKFYNWWNETRAFQGGENNDRAFTRTLLISLLDENHEPIVNWKVLNAWPVKVQSTDLNSTNSETAIETLEIAHEGLTIEFR